MIDIICNYESSFNKLNLLEVKKISTMVLNSKNIQDGEVSFVFVSDEFLASMKKKYFNKNQYTDVIAFRLNDYEEQKRVDGEIYISLSMAKENAELFEEPYEKEIVRLIIHGCLHLIGIKDKTVEEKNIMTRMEDEFLKKISWIKIVENLNE